MKESIMLMLAIIGIFAILKGSINFFWKGDKTPAKTSLVLIVYNWENYLERVIRYIGTSCYFNDNFLCPVDIIVIDKGSTDSTMSIAKGLQRQFYNLKVYEELDIKNCQGDVILYIDTTKLSLSAILNIIKGYFGNSVASPKVLEKNLEK